MTEQTFSYLIGVAAALILAGLSYRLLGRRKSRRFLGIRRGRIVPVIVFVVTLAVAGAVAGWFSTPEGTTRLSSRASPETERIQLDSLLNEGQHMSAVGNVQGAVELFGEAATRAIEIQDDMLTGRAFAGLAECYALLGDVEQAREYYRDRALPLFADRAFKVPRGEAIASRALGDLERRVGDRDSARGFYARSRELFASMNDDVGVASVLHGLSQLERSEGQVDSARVHLTLADSLLTQQGHILGRANVLHSFGDLEIELGDVDTARAYYTEALALARQARNPLGEANALYGLGNTALVKQDEKMAQENFTEAEVIYERIGNRLGQANIAVALGDLQILRRDATEAARHYEKAIGLYRGIGMQDEATVIDQKLRRIRLPEADIDG